MCSNCSGDDLGPETFASFDVSSPEHSSGFAASRGRKRKRYGTSRVWEVIVNSLLTLGFLRAGRKATNPQIIRTVDRADFVNLNLGGFYGEGGTKTGSSAGSEGLIEIRVSADSIIEVYSGAHGARDREEHEAREYEHMSAWEESYAERSELGRILNRFRRTRRLKYLMAFGAFATAVALAVWCAVR
jgi:hypothetical protein